MRIETAEGKGLIVFQPSKTENLNYVSTVASPFNGEGCLLHLNAPGTLEVKFLEDSVFRLVTIANAGFAPMLVKEVKNTNDFANIEFAAR